MKKYTLTAILFASFASACTVNMGSSANTKAANPNQTSSSSGSPANSEKSATETKTETAKKNEADTSKKSAEIDTKNEEQIQFAKGETDTTLVRTIAPNASKMFLFNVRKGQTLWFKVTENSNQLEVDFNKNSVQLGEEVRESLNASGEWAIYVSNPTDKPLTYKLWIGIE